MHLRRLEAYGFKSFADRVSFDFEKGVTIIVGPNGCGKSNVVDAVKWVLGDQSPKSLRGTEMLDCIFNGSATRKRMNFAEVTLYFDNHDRRLPVDIDEVSVTRRLFRSGESEYFIGKGRCRLRDIKEMFLDTGIGTASYSIIEQNRVQALLEATAQQRRAVFEEAAGISKYKQRKLAAIRRLERLDADLLRLGDHVAELERRLRSVRQQAARARKHQEISEQLQAKRLVFDLARYEEMSREYRQLVARREEARARADAVRVELGSTQAEITTGEEQEIALAEHLETTQVRRDEKQEQLVGLENELSVLGERRRAAHQEAGRAQAAAGAARELVAGLERGLAGCRTRLAELQEEARTLEAAEKNCDQENAQAAETCRGLAMELTERKSRALDLAGRLSQCRSELTGLKRELRGLLYAWAGSGGTLLQLRRDRTQAAGELESARRRAECLAFMERALERTRARMLSRQEVARRWERELEERIRRLEGEREARRREVALLREMQKRRQGAAAGVRAVLAAAAQGQLGGVQGILADFLRAGEENARAVEAALGECLEWIICADEASRTAVVQFLRAGEQGRAGTVVPAAVSDPPSPEPSCAEGFVPLLELIQAEKDASALAKRLCARCFVAPSAESALAADAATWKDARLVTRSGLSVKFLDGSSAIEAGSGTGERLELLVRRGRIEKAEAEIEQLAAQREALCIQLDAAGRRRMAVEAAASRLAEDLARVQTALARAREQAKAARQGITRLREQATVAKAEHEDAARQAGQLREKTAHLAEQEAELAGSEHELRAQIEAAETLLRQAGARREAAAARLADLRVKLAEGRGKLARVSQEAAHLAANLAERAAEIKRLQENEQQALAECRQLEAAISTANERLAQTLLEREELDRQRQSLSAQRQEVREKLEAARRRERELNLQSDAARQEDAQMQADAARASVQLETLTQQALVTFGTRLEEELQRRGGHVELDPELRQEIEQLERRLAHLGLPNYGALEEERQISQRLEERQAQYEDLQSAQRKLRDIITRINVKSKKRFLDTFEAVQAQFNQMFRALFGGGRADIRLEEGIDVLEAGIEVIAKPPGKEPVRISQLSGGEKALTTIALILAIFRSRPSPFCLLDEVDAPLDEANVDRFCQVLKEFLDKSQFVIITHNKKTISYADAIYGVTMVEGISRKYSMRYEEFEAGREPAALAGD